MLEIIAIVLFTIWFVGLVTSTITGGFIHIFLLIAVVALLIRIIRGRRQYQAKSSIRRIQAFNCQPL